MTKYGECDIMWQEWENEKIVTKWVRLWEDVSSVKKTSEVRQNVIIVTKCEKCDKPENCNNCDKCYKFDKCDKIWQMWQVWQKWQVWQTLQIWHIWGVCWNMTHLSNCDKFDQIWRV